MGRSDLMTPKFSVRSGPCYRPSKMYPSWSIFQGPCSGNNIQFIWLRRYFPAKQVDLSFVFIPEATSGKFKPGSWIFSCLEQGDSGSWDLEEQKEGLLGDFLGCQMSSVSCLWLLNFIPYYLLYIPERRNELLSQRPPQNQDCSVSQLTLPNFVCVCLGFCMCLLY